jgi:hypothetical protein
MQDLGGQVSNEVQLAWAADSDGGRMPRGFEMTGFQDIAPEHLAMLFFHYREALAPDFPSGPVKRPSGGSSWETVHSNERSLMVATARLVLLELCCSTHQGENSDHGSSDKNEGGAGQIEGSEGKECGC